LSAIPSGRFDIPNLEQRLVNIEHATATQDTATPATANYTREVAQIRELLAHYAARRCALPSGLIHGDLFRDNVLFAGVESPVPSSPALERPSSEQVPDVSDRIVALLDFESACHGHFAYDVMVCMLAWCYTSHFEVHKARALLAGYQSVRPLSTLEREQLHVEGALACLRFATTRITDFALRTPAGAIPQRDYRRFLTRLDELQTNLISEVLQ
jgi:Ser/Thr protein kinase RdoA (MazF antagonist)